MPDRIQDSKLVRHVRRWPRRVLYAVVAMLVILVAARIALPYVVKHQINQRLGAIPGYAGNVEDVGIHLWRGAYSLHGVGIYKHDGGVRHPFFLAQEIDFSIAWRELFRGKIVSDIDVDGGQLVFVKGASEETSTTSDTDRRWQQVIQDIFPIDITQLELNHGLLRYVDNTREPAADLFVRNMSIVATGLRNRREERGEEFPAHITLIGDTLGGGKIGLDILAEPLADQPHFELKMKVDDVSLPALNESLKAYANVDVGRGMFRMAGEMAGRDGGFQGYIKPFFEDLDFKNLADARKSIGERLWEKVVAGLAWLVKNKPRDQVATRIPFQGRFGDPQVGLWRTIANLFRHGFIQAFNPTVEGTIHADNVRPDGKTAESGKEAAKAGAPTGRAQGPEEK